jgi:hypothetical protein
MVVYEVVARKIPWKDEGKSTPEIDKAIKAEFAFDQDLEDDFGMGRDAQLARWTKKNPIEQRRPNLSFIQAGCPPLLLDLMQRCWADDQHLRPSFAAIHDTLKAAVEGGGSPAVAADLPRNFATSRYKQVYSSTRCPEPHQTGKLFGAVSTIVDEYANRRRFPPQHATSFFKDLVNEWNKDDCIAGAAQKLWTSTKNGIGKEFCSILCDATRGDIEEVIAEVAVIARAINADLVARGGGSVDRPFPRGPAGAGLDESTEHAVTWRGGGFADTDENRAFFVPGKQYRAPQFLATSFERRVATTFVDGATMGGAVNARALWRVELDPDRGCDHVQLVTESHVRREREFLFTVYSVFTVKAVQWVDPPNDPTNTATPHRITIQAAVNNKDHPEDLPLAPWC